jgi:hypothetical protein
LLSSFGDFAMPSNYLPQPLPAFQAFAANFAAKTTAAPATYGLVAGDATTIATANTTFQAAYTTSTTPATRTKVTVQATINARNALVQIIRAYGRLILANQGVADADKIALGLHLRDTVNTPIPAPSTAPVVAVIGVTPGVLTATFRDSMSSPGVKAKPFGATQLLLYVAFGTVAPVTPGATPFRQAVTKTPFAIDTTAGTVGQTAFVYGRWQNQKGEVGPWSSLATSVIG